MEIAKFILLSLFIILTFLGCANNTQIQKKNPNIKKIQNIEKNKDENKKKSDFKSNEIKSKNLSIKNMNGILTVSENTQEYVISSNGIDYNPHLSVNKNNLVVDILLSNNLNTIKLFQKDYKFQKVLGNLKKIVLTNFLEKNNYLLKDISFFEIKFFQWIDNDSFEILILGEHKDKRFEEKIRYKFPVK